MRTNDLLPSSIAQREATFGGHYLHADIFRMAAACLLHLVKNHPFIDGNKRIGFEASLVFLQLNGQSIEVGDGRSCASVNVCTDYFLLYGNRLVK